ncbi:hypothetical protein JYU34_006393 [Plutella xylostella]|uniref:Peptidase S1 domain-containing protein n=1 Tax=Plutella xylostella TaxID=51655 RepID=A0ABQ7QS07_PLUXY|nr:hypothetical protein JYU34_006393 [Plutella xylostella]
MRVLYAFVLCVAAAAAVPAPSPPQSRIVGGSTTTISRYPYGAATLYSWDGSSYWQGCGGAVLTPTAVLSAAHCYYFLPGNGVITPSRWRVRVGSTYANSGGSVFTLRSIIMHPNYDSYSNDFDFAILRTVYGIPLTNIVQQVAIASPTYNLPDNSPVWAIGWGLTAYQGQASEQLKHVEVWTFNQNTCRNRLAQLGYGLTDNMLCSGWLDVGGRGQCNGDSGSPLIHYNQQGQAVVVGVTSWGIDCATAAYGSVSARVSRVSVWIQQNAA